MMKKLAIILILLLSIFTDLRANDDLKIVRQRVIADLMKTNFDDTEVERLMLTLQENGGWPSINYIDTSKLGWEHPAHLKNLLKMSVAYKTKDSGFHLDQKLKTAIDKALNFWLDHDFIADNWFNNQIGTPRSVLYVLLVLDESLSEEQKAKAAPIVGRGNLNAYGARPGGDMIRVAEIVAKYALFKNDESTFIHASNIIEGEAKFATGRGLQYDYSFQHRKYRVTTTLTYGLHYAESYAYWIEKVAGTKYQFSNEHLKLFTDYFLDGICKTMSYGKYPDPAAQNRSVTRVGILKPHHSEIPKKILLSSSYRKDELEKIIEIRNGESKADFSYSTFFWHSEFFSFQRPDFYTSVRMFSNRNHNMEQPYNGEGLLNHHYADGSNFISRTGREYYNIFPVLDWQKIPGTTILQKPEMPSENEIQKRGLSDFVGAATDGKYGVVAFDFKDPHSNLVAKKAWFFFDTEYVCLGTNINTRSDLFFPAVTTVNQCLLNGDVTVKTGSNQAILEAGQHELKNVKWVLHDSIAYIFPKPTHAMLKNESATGSWFKINCQADSPKELITKDVFKLWIDHGSDIDEGNYEYIVAPGMTREKISQKTVEKELDILANNSKIQAVRHLQLDITQIVFYEGGEFELSKDLKVGTDGPALFMIKGNDGSINEITISDPTRRQKKLHFYVSQQIDEKSDQCDVVWDEEKGLSLVSVELPQGVYAGKSISLKF